MTDEMMRTSRLPSSMATLLAAVKTTTWVLTGNHFQPALHYVTHMSRIFILYLVYSISSLLLFHFIIFISIIIIIILLLLILYYLSEIYSLFLFMRTLLIFFSVDEGDAS